MASEVDICNLALSRLGDNATVASIDPPEGSAQAEHCALFYPLARDSLLEMHPWKFATRRVLLARLAVPTWDWQYAYAWPADALRVLAVLPQTASSDDETQAFVVEAAPDGSPMILSNQEAASLRYIGRTTDTTRFPPLVSDCLAWLLASYLAGPVIKGDAGAGMAKTCLQSFLFAFSQAKVSDANQQKTRPKHVPQWISAR